jgi:NitT/TauT family transport system ATP-binding protein
MQTKVADVNKLSQASNECLIKIRNLSKIFYSKNQEVVALDNINLDIEKGKFVSILGPSGCGKSTLMTLMAGLEPVTSGSIEIEGKLVSQPYENLGMVFQNALLLDWRKVINNVLLQIEMRGLSTEKYYSKAEALLESVGLSGFEQSYPFQLSGGMRQRVSICRALVHDPELLLLDEPFSALDAISRDKICLDVQRMWEGNHKTAVFITHSITEAIFLSDKVYIMSPRPGKIVEELHIDLPRPRDINIRETPEFTKYVSKIREVFIKTGIM